MSRPLDDAPLQRDAMALLGVMADELGSGAREALLDHLLRHCMSLLDDVTLAVAGHRRRERLEDADAGLRLVRTYSSLALDLSMIDEELFLDLSEQADLIGRQIGGWLKNLQRPAEVPGRAKSLDTS